MEALKLLWGLALMAAAAFTDARERRVPNRLLLLGLAGRGVLYAAELLTGPEEFGAALLGAGRHGKQENFCRDTFPFS